MHWNDRPFYNKIIYALAALLILIAVVGVWPTGAVFMVVNLLGVAVFGYVVVTILKG